jgi:hypothetical protein
MNRLQQKKILFLIDGDGINPKIFAGAMSNFEPQNSIEIFCNFQSAKAWTYYPEFELAKFYLTKMEPQAADRRLTSRLINLMVDHSKTMEAYSRIWIWTNDCGFKRDLIEIASIIPIGIASQTEKLLRIPCPNIEYLRINNRITQPQGKVISSRPFNPYLIKEGNTLVQIGQLLHRNNVSYRKLSKFLAQNGYTLDKDKQRVISVPFDN